MLSRLIRQRISGPRSSTSSTSDLRMSWLTPGRVGSSISRPRSLRIALITSISVAQGVGEVAQGDSAQGVGDVAQGGSTRSDDGDYDDVFSVPGSVDKYEGAFSVIDCHVTDSASEDYDDHAFGSVGRNASEPECCREDTCPRRSHRWPPGHCVPGTRPTRGACVRCPESRLLLRVRAVGDPAEPHWCPIRGFGPGGD